MTDIKSYPASRNEGQTFDASDLITAVNHSTALQNSDAFSAVASFIKDRNIGDFIESRLQVQKLLDDGLTAGAAALVNLAQESDPDGKVMGALKARAWKELAIHTSQFGAAEAKVAVANAMNEYQLRYHTSPEGRTRAGINLIALATLARQLDVPVPSEIDRMKLAVSILEDLNRTPPAARDSQFHASRAEAYVALDDLDRAQVDLGKVAQDQNTTAEMLGAVTRQLRDLSKLGQRSEQGAGIIQALSAAILTRNFDIAKLRASDVRELAERPAPPNSQLEAILGRDGPLSYRWVKMGMESAQSVGVVRTTGPAKRIGSAFIVRGGNIVPSLGDELCVLTNAHVVSSDARDNGLPPDEVEILFEAADESKIYTFSEIARSWWRGHLDATLLRFNGDAPPLKPLSFAKNLPLADGTQRVYIIGYPNGAELSFSMQHNNLIDHEGPPHGTPPDKSVCRVHYTAPTEPGSSGSPVFNAHNWGVIALHHAGDEKAMNRLNGRTDSWPANEGIWIQSICAAGRA